MRGLAMRGPSALLLLAPEEGRGRRTLLKLACSMLSLEMRTATDTCGLDEAHALRMWEHDVQGVLQSAFRCGRQVAEDNIKHLGMTQLGSMVTGPNSLARVFGVPAHTSTGNIFPS